MRTLDSLGAYLLRVAVLDDGPDRTRRRTGVGSWPTYRADHDNPATPLGDFERDFKTDDRTMDSIRAFP